MPCYDPRDDPYPRSPQAREEKRRYVQQLKDIEEFLKPYRDVYSPTPEAAAAQVIAATVIEMIHAPWRS